MGERVITSFAFGYSPNQDVNFGSNVDFTEVQTNNLVVGGAGGVGTEQYSLPPADGLENQIITMQAGEALWADPLASNPFDQDLNTTDDVKFNSVDGAVVGIKNPGTGPPEWQFSVLAADDDLVLDSNIGGFNRAMVIRPEEFINFNLSTTVNNNFSVRRPGNTARVIQRGETADYRMEREGNLTGFNGFTFSGGLDTLFLGQTADHGSDMVILDGGPIGTPLWSMTPTGNVSANGMEAKNSFALGPSGPAHCTFPVDVSMRDAGDQLFYTGAGAAVWNQPNRQTLAVGYGLFTTTAMVVQQELISGLPSSRGSFTIPSTLLSDPSNIGRTFKLNMSGWMTTTNAADVITLIFQMTDVVAVVTANIGISASAFDIQSPRTNSGWECELQFCVSGFGVGGEPRITTGGYFHYTGGGGVLGNNALEGSCFTPISTGTGYVELLSADNDIRVDVAILHDAVDLLSTFTIARAELVLDSL